MGRVYLGVVVFSSFGVVENHGNVGLNVASTAGLKVGLYGLGVVDFVVVDVVGNWGNGVGVR